MVAPLTRTTLVGVAPEVTEGLYVAPTGAQVIQVVDFPSFSPEIETIERNLIRNSIGRDKSLKGIHTGTVELSVEMRAAGETAGVSDEPEANELFLSAFGRRTTSGNSVTVGGSTDTIINVDTGEGAAWETGDILRLDGEVRFVRSVSGDVLTLNRALANGAPSASETVNRGFTYKLASNDHNPLSITGFFDDGTQAWEQRMTGCRNSALGFTDFSTGQIPKIAMTFEVLDHTAVVGTAVTPVFEDQVPPVALGGTSFKDTTEFCINNFEFNMAQVVTAETCIKSDGGRERLFITDRQITGSFDPLMDAATVQIFTDWVNNTDFEIENILGIKDSAGNILQGTAVGSWMPQVNYTSNGIEDGDGLVKHNLEFSAHESTSLNDEVYMGFV